MPLAAASIARSMPTAFPQLPRGQGRVIRRGHNPARQILRTPERQLATLETAFKFLPLSQFRWVVMPGGR